MLRAMILEEMAVSYHEGWDPEARTTVGPLSTAAAHKRHRTGEQYAVLLSLGGRPLVLIEVACASHYIGTWLIDEEGRRYFHIDGRLLAEDRFFLQGMRKWFYTDGEQPEFDPTAARRRWEVFQNDRMRLRDEPGGDKGGLNEASREIDSDQFWLDVPGFGAWQLFAAFLAMDAERDEWEVSPDLVLTDVSIAESEELPADRRPWHPPRPLQPRNIDLLFTPGTRFEVPNWGTGSVHVQRAGTQRFPSGRIAAHDPGWLEYDVKPFTTSIPPGDHELLLSLVLRGDDPPEHGQVAAAKLAITDEEAVTWELALRAGQDPRTLDEGAFFGFGVDTGTGCFLDIAATEALARIFGEAMEEGFEDSPMEVTDPETGANIIAFHTGWGDGSYPTWIGRTKTGDIACLVADMLIVHEADPLPPAG
jgi:hypothetical protein